MLKLDKIIRINKFFTVISLYPDIKPDAENSMYSSINGKFLRKKLILVNEELNIQSSSSKKCQTDNQI